MNELDYLTDQQLQMSAERLYGMLHDWYDAGYLFPDYEEMKAELDRRYSYHEIESAAR